MTYLGIDVGTSCVKAVLIDAEQISLAEASISLNISRPKPLWSEQNPEEWWQATLQAIEKIAGTCPKGFAALHAIGLTGQMHGATCLDVLGKPLYPAILWNDGRAHAECDVLMQDAADFVRVTGNLVMPGFTAPKLLWLKKHEPKIFKAINKILLPKDYIRWRLSGVYASDVSDAAGTSWLDVGARQWSEALLAATSLTLEQMPKVFEGTEITGELHRELQQRWQIKNSVKIIAGGGDNAAGAVSLGMIRKDRAMLSLGTSGVYFVANDNFNPYPQRAVHTFCHCVPKKWHQMGVILSAASSLAWWRHVTGLNEKELTQEVMARKITSTRAPIFLPHLSGERTPHNDSFAQGVFFGMTHETTRADLTEALLEGVAFAIFDCQEVLREVGTQAETVAVIGGGARNKYWGQILANVLNKPLLYHNESNLGSAFGAARLALVADLELDIIAVATTPKITAEIMPQPQQHLFYLERFAKYRKLYLALRESFRN